MKAKSAADAVVPPPPPQPPPNQSNRIKYSFWIFYRIPNFLLLFLATAVVAQTKQWSRKKDQHYGCLSFKELCLFSFFPSLFIFILDLRFFVSGTTICISYFGNYAEMAFIFDETAWRFDSMRCDMNCRWLTLHLILSQKSPEKKWKHWKYCVSIKFIAWIVKMNSLNIFGTYFTQQCRQ